MDKKKQFEAGVMFQFAPRGKYYRFMEERNRSYLAVMDGGQWVYKGAISDITDNGCMLYLGEHIGTYFYEFQDLFFSHEQAAA